MEHAVGEWNGFVFTEATEKDVEAIQEIMHNQYFPDEPMTKLLGISEEYEAEFRKVWSYFLKDRLSFIATDKATNTVAGIRIIFDHNKDIDWTQFSFQSPQALKLLSLTLHMDEQSNLSEKYGLDTYADFLFTTVHRDFRGRGLATEMYRRALTMSKAKGYKLAKCTFSSPYSRAAGARVGFQQVAFLDLAVATDANGERLCENATEEKMSQAIYILNDE